MRNLGSECVYFWNVDDFEGNPPRFQHLIDPALSQSLSTQGGRHPVRRGQPLRASHARDARQTPKADAKIFRNDEDGDVIATIKDQELKVATTKR